MADPRPVLLLVEDDPDHQLLTELALRRAGVDADIHTLPSGELALQYLLGMPPFEDVGRFPRPALVLLDLGLPGMSGFDVLRAMREAVELRSVPVLVITVSTEERDRERAFELGAVEFCQKPSDFSLLAPIVRDLIGRRGNLAVG